MDLTELICIGVLLLQVVTFLLERAREWLPAVQGRLLGPSSADAPVGGPAEDMVRLYRINRTNKASGITFAEPSAALELGTREIAGLVDALSGAPLVPSPGLYRCPRCQVFYNPHSVVVLRAENGGRCVSCLRPGLIAVRAVQMGRDTAVRAVQMGRNAAVSPVTLANYRRLVGRVITFEGYVPVVYVSQRGLDYAVMFENRAWVHGFKAVVFRGDVERVGGREFILGLENKRVRVRGLLVHHETFGYEVIVSEPGMIETVR